MVLRLHGAEVHGAEASRYRAGKLVFYPNRIASFYQSKKKCNRIFTAVAINALNSDLI